ncbi:hypothetical protein DPMN_181544 [Dreissena polymorpha]|uniref:Uncharacterized protein n=1 Tax=Dreissena polymorpha TaxID=45954 RepID=A0A9D4DCJ6_DREPO|nr:hypothetical protein DPMN_181544 [Dreissena polymorpha]
MAEVAAFPANAYTLVALVARHVVNESRSEYLTVGNDLRVIGRFDRTGTDEGVDVLPIDVYAECEQDCDTRFKTELCVSMTTTQLPNKEDIRTLIEMNKPVHIWGATSAPGLGTLTEIVDSANGDYIKIRDRQEGRPFAQKGDSGAMVCYFDARREVLYAVAILVEVMSRDEGDQNEGYLAHILDIALQKLSIVNGYDFVFI